MAYCFDTIVLQLWRIEMELTEEQKAIIYGEVVAELCPENLFYQIEGEYYQRIQEYEEEGSTFNRFDN